LVKLNKIYTRTGDSGETGLADGSRIPKDHPRAIAIGDVDELNSLIGAALSHIGRTDAREMLERIQNELFDLGADLATPGADFSPSATALRIVPAQVERLEAEIDKLNESLEPLRSFILPGGGGGSARVHVARSAARRAERPVIPAGRSDSLTPLAQVYLNRLSDLLFVLARSLASDHGGEVLWRPGASRG